MYLLYSNFTFAGNTNQAPVQVNPQTGQPDYSAQWAEYYRSLGMHREADMIEQQAKQGKQDHNQQGGTRIFTIFFTIFTFLDGKYLLERYTRDFTINLTIIRSNKLYFR